MSNNTKCWNHKCHYSLLEGLGEVDEEIFLHYSTKTNQFQNKVLKFLCVLRRNKVSQFCLSFARLFGSFFDNNDSLQFVLTIVEK